MSAIHSGKVPAMTRVKETSWWIWLHATAHRAGDRLQKDIAKKLSVSEAAVSSWSKGTPPSPEIVRRAARAYDENPIDLMRIAFLDDEEPDSGNPKARSTKRGKKFEISPRPDVDTL